jgi:hypothetical protein
MGKVQRSTLILPDALAQKIACAAALSGQSKASFIRSAIIDALENRRLKELALNPLIMFGQKNTV